MMVYDVTLTSFAIA